MSSAWCDAVLSWLLPLAGLSSTKVRWTDEPGHEMAQFHHHHCVYVCRINVGVFCQQGLCTGLSQGSGVLNISWVEGFEQSEFKMRIPSRKLPVMERRPWVWGSKLLLLRLLHFILLNLNLIWFFFSLYWLQVAFPTGSLPMVAGRQASWVQEERCFWRWVRRPWVPWCVVTLETGKSSLYPLSFFPDSVLDPIMMHTWLSPGPGLS